MPKPEEAQRVIEAVQGLWRIMISLMSATGLRAGKVRALRWEAADQKRRRFAVQEAVKKSARGHREEVRNLKRDASVRTIQIPDAFLEQLKQLPKRGGWVFSSESGDLISADYFLDQMQRAVKASGVEWHGTLAHFFYHFACSLFMHEFSNPKRCSSFWATAASP